MTAAKQRARARAGVTSGLAGAPTQARGPRACPSLARARAHRPPPGCPPPPPPSSRGRSGSRGPDPTRCPAPAPPPRVLSAVRAGMADVRARCSGWDAAEVQCRRCEGR
eukprot:1383346-Rhodomonas_salina.9